MLLQVDKHEWLQQEGQPPWLQYPGIFLQQMINRFGKFQHK